MLTHAIAALLHASVPDYGAARIARAPDALDGQVAFRVETSGRPLHGDALNAGANGRVGFGLGLYGEIAVERRGLDGELRPAAGVGYQILGEDEDDLALAVFGQLRSEGFTEIEAEFEL